MLVLPSGRETDHALLLLREQGPAPGAHQGAAHPLKSAPGIPAPPWHCLPCRLWGWPTPLWRCGRLWLPCWRSWTCCWALQSCLSVRPPPMCGRRCCRQTAGNWYW